METFFSSICDYAHDAHWIIFLLLMLAGLNIPISEDVLLITGGAIASTCIPEHTLRLYLWIYFGTWLSAWEAYWLGRLLGPKLYKIKWFARFISPERVDKLHHYYEKFGVFTFMVGRFIPGGVRNALFISSGLGKMPFLKFILRDGFSCIFSSAFLFFLGYWFGEHYEKIVEIFKTYNLIVVAIVIGAISLGTAAFWLKKRKISWPG